MGGGEGGKEERASEQKPRGKRINPPAGGNDARSPATLRLPQEGEASGQSLSRSLLKVTGEKGPLRNLPPRALAVTGAQGRCRLCSPA